MQISEAQLEFNGRHRNRAGRGHRSALCLCKSWSGRPTIQSVPFLFVNGCSPALTRGVVWVYSNTQTYAYNSRTLELRRVFDGSPGFAFGFDPLGAFVSDTAALNAGSISVYRSHPLMGIR